MKSIRTYLMWYNHGGLYNRRGGLVERDVHSFIDTGANEINHKQVVLRSTDSAHAVQVGVHNNRPITIICLQANTRVIYHIP